jgi:hypothetical protein
LESWATTAEYKNKVILLGFCKNERGNAQPTYWLLPFILILCLFPAVIFADTIHGYQTISDIINSVSIDNIMKTISDLQENRDINSPNKAYKSRYCLRVRETDNPSDGACDNAGDYIFKKLSNYGLQVEFATFDHVITDKSTGKQNHYKMKNVVSTLLGKGSHSDKIFIICAHYDSIAGLSAEWMWNWGIMPAPGADDNASGTSALIEIARILSQYEFDFTVKFIAFSGEELGMFGSKDYAKKAFSLNQQIAGVIDLDMIGYDPDELDIDITTDQDSEWLANAIDHNREEFGMDLKINKTIDPKMIYSDHSSFWKLGYSAILVNEGVNPKSEKSPENHTIDDTIDKLTPDLILKTSKLIISTLARLADPIDETDNETNADLAVDVSIISKPESPITLEAHIKNLGDEKADNVTTQIWLIPPETWEQPRLIREIKSNLKPEMSQTISETLSLNSWGDYQVVIRVNPDYAIFESDYTNNVAKASINISADYGVSDLTIYPNPASIDKKSEINIRYRLSDDTKVELNILDITGNLIFSKEFSPGENGGLRGPNNNVKWNTLSVYDSNQMIASGIYICQIIAEYPNGERRSISKKLALIR